MTSEDFPLLLEQASFGERVVERFGWQLGTLGLATLGLAALGLRSAEADLKLDFASAFLSLFGVFMVYAEISQRKKNVRTTLCVSEGKVGIYRKGRLDRSMGCSEIPLADARTEPWAAGMLAVAFAIGAANLASALYSIPWEPNRDSLFLGTLFCVGSLLSAASWAWTGPLCRSFRLPPPRGSGKNVGPLFTVPRAEADRLVRELGFGAEAEKPELAALKKGFPITLTQVPAAECLFETIGWQFGAWGGFLLAAGSWVLAQRIPLAWKTALGAGALIAGLAMILYERRRHRHRTALFLQGQDIGVYRRGKFDMEVTRADLTVIDAGKVGFLVYAEHAVLFALLPLVGVFLGALPLFSKETSAMDKFTGLALSAACLFSIASITRTWLLSLAFNVPYKDGTVEEIRVARSQANRLAARI